MQRLLITIAACVAFATAAQAQQLTKVRVAYDGFSMTSGPLMYADNRGIFKKFGLDVTPVFVDNGSMLTQAVVDGSVDIAQNSYPPAVSAAVEGAGIVIIGGISNKLPFQLVVKDEIKTAADLKGRSIAISRYGSAADIAAGFALARLKLSRSDVKILQLGGGGTRISAVMSGEIAGTMEQYPDTAELLRQGFHVLVDVTDIAGEFPNTAYVARRDYLKANPEVVKAFFKSMATAVHEYKTNSKFAILLTQGFLNLQDRGSARAAYEAYTKIYPDDLRPSLNALERVLGEIGQKNPKATSIKPAELVDTSALDALTKEGFFKGLAGK